MRRFLTAAFPKPRVRALVAVAVVFVCCDDVIVERTVVHSRTLSLSFFSTKQKARKKERRSGCNDCASEWMD